MAPRFSSLLAAALVSLPGAAAWWADGHMLTAKIAYDQLSPTTKAVCDQLVGVLATDYPTSPDFVTAAVWADDLKSLGVNQWNNDHFIDLPVVKGAYWWDLPAVGNTTNNPWAITQAVITLTTPQATDLDRAMQLRFILHFVGDLHQPLHAATMFSTEFSRGDYGGNSYKIAGVNESNLHSLWDSGIEQWSTDLDRPLNATGEEWLSSWETTIVTAYPQASFANELDITNVWQWGVDSNAIAADWVYTAPQAPTPIPESYINASQAKCQQLVALGGYRLAQLLESLFNPSSPFYGVYAKAAIAAVEEATAKDGPQVAHARALRGGRN